MVEDPPPVRALLRRAGVLPVQVVRGAVADVDQRRGRELADREEVCRSEAQHAAKDGNLIRSDDPRDEHGHFIIQRGKHEFEKVRVHLDVLAIGLVRCEEAVHNGQ